jgi:hypothetical protein
MIQIFLTTNFIHQGHTADVHALTGFFSDESFDDLC